MRGYVLAGTLERLSVAGEDYVGEGCLAVRET